MQRYFMKEDAFENNEIIFKGNEVHHIKNVMRYGVGDKIEVFNYSGNGFLAEITTLGKNEVVAKVLKQYPLLINHINITLAQSLIKRDQFELVLQKTTELGVKEIIPLQSKRSIIKIHDADKKAMRYVSILKEASEQSERSMVPNLKDIQDVYSLPYHEYDHVIVAYAREDNTQTLSLAIEKIHPQESVLILVGPEGGFSDEELEFLRDKATFVSLGKTILRSETAAIYMLSAFRYAWEN